MASIIINLPDSNTADYLDRINGCVCVNGSSMIRFGRFEAVLVYPDPDDSDGRSDLTGQEAATFVRNFLDEGFCDKITVS